MIPSLTTRRVLYWILGSSDLQKRQFCFKLLAYSYSADLLKLNKVQFSFGKKWYSPCWLRTSSELKINPSEILILGGNG